MFQEELDDSFSDEELTSYLVSDINWDKNKRSNHVSGLQADQHVTGSKVTSQEAFSQTPQIHITDSVKHEDKQTDTLKSSDKPQIDAICKDANKKHNVSSASVESSEAESEMKKTVENSISAKCYLIKAKELDFLCEQLNINLTRSAEQLLHDKSLDLSILESSHHRSCNIATVPNKDLQVKVQVVTLDVRNVWRSRKRTSESKQSINTTKTGDKQQHVDEDNIKQVLESDLSMTISDASSQTSLEKKRPDKLSLQECASVDANSVHQVSSKSTSCAVDAKSDVILAEEFKVKTKASSRFSRKGNSLVRVVVHDGKTYETSLYQGQNKIVSSDQDSASINQAFPCPDPGQSEVIVCTPTVIIEDTADYTSGVTLIDNIHTKGAEKVGGQIKNHADEDQGNLEGTAEKSETVGTSSEHMMSNYNNLRQQGFIDLSSDNECEELERYFCTKQPLSTTTVQTAHVNVTNAHSTIDRNTIGVHSSPGNTEFFKLSPKKVAKMSLSPSVEQWKSNLQNQFLQKLAMNQGISLENHTLKTTESGTQTSDTKIVSNDNSSNGATNLKNADDVIPVTISQRPRRGRAKKTDIKTAGTTADTRKLVKKAALVSKTVVRTLRERTSLTGIKSEIRKGKKLALQKRKGQHLLVKKSKAMNCGQVDKKVFCKGKKKVTLSEKSDKDAFLNSEHKCQKSPSKAKNMDKSIIKNVKDKRRNPEQKSSEVIAPKSCLVKTDTKLGKRRGLKHLCSENKKRKVAFKNDKDTVVVRKRSSRSKRKVNDGWKDLLDDSSFKIDEKQLLSREPVNVKKMLRDVLGKEATVKNVKKKHQSSSQHRSKLNSTKSDSRNSSGSKSVCMSDSEESWWSDGSGHSSMFPGFELHTGQSGSASDSQAVQTKTHNSNAAGNHLVISQEVILVREPVSKTVPQKGDN